MRQFVKFPIALEEIGAKRTGVHYLWLGCFRRLDQRDTWYLPESFQDKVAGITA